jgi:plastocyanin
MRTRSRRFRPPVAFLVSVVLAAAALASRPAGALDLKGSVLLLAKGGKVIDRSADVRTAVVIWRPDTPVKGVATNRSYVMSTRQKEFEPRVLTIPVGATVTFPNADPILHNAFSVSEGNKFDLGLARKGPGKTWTFKNPGLVRVFCNVHHSMIAYIWVLDTPFYAQPDGSGNFQLQGLPAGPGTLEVWHEQTDLGKQTLKMPQADPVTVKLEITKPRVPSHLNKTGQSYNLRDDSY